jgi:hypothetical protein
VKGIGEKGEIHSYRVTIPQIHMNITGYNPVEKTISKIIENITAHTYTKVL